MTDFKHYGDYSKSSITNNPADLNTETARNLKKTLIRFPEEAIYIYSFKENKMIYADGWEELLGYRDDEITMLTIVSITTPEYILFSNELNDKALLFIQNKTEELEKYSFTIELKKFHKNGTPVPLISRVGVFRSEKGKVTEIIGRSQLSRTLKSEFEENLNRALFTYFAISEKEKEALELVAKGYSFKQVADLLKVSQSAIEKRIIPLYKRFDVKSLTHLISFAIENNIL